MPRARALACPGGGWGWWALRVAGDAVQYRIVRTEQHCASNAPSSRANRLRGPWRHPPLSPTRVFPVGAKILQPTQAKDLQGHVVQALSTAKNLVIVVEPEGCVRTMACLCLIDKSYELVRCLALLRLENCTVFLHHCLARCDHTSASS